MPVVYSQHGVIVKTAGFDVIGGRRYNTIQMPDGKTWMAENLDFKFCGVINSSTSSIANAWYYDNNEATYGWNGYKCGLLYNWYAVKLLNDNRTDLCPGWHVPTSSEWDALATAVGGASTAGKRLKASDVSWAGSWVGDDDYGFAVLPAGAHVYTYMSIGTNADYWSVSEYSASNGYSKHFYTGDDLVSDNRDKTHAYSVRLVRDSQ